MTDKSPLANMLLQKSPLASITMVNNSYINNINKVIY